MHHCSFPPFSRTGWGPNSHPVVAADQKLPLGRTDSSRAVRTVARRFWRNLGRVALLMSLVVGAPGCLSSFCCLLLVLAPIGEEDATQLTPSPPPAPRGEPAAVSGPRGVRPQLGKGRMEGKWCCIQLAPSKLTWLSSKSVAT